jgi:hypothetical protein
VDDFAAKNASLKTKADGLAVEKAQLRADQTKAQDLVDKHRAKAESKERSLRRRLQTALNLLRSKFYPLSDLKSTKVVSFC